MPSFNKLNAKLSKETVDVIYNEQTITIKQYLPIEEKLKLFQTVLDLSVDQSKFYNIAKVDVFFTLQVIECYTNITFTEKQKEVPYKLYDIVVSSELYNLIMKNIPYSEISFLYENLIDIIKNIYKYSYSALGILENMGQDYSQLNFDLDELQDKIQDPENLGLLKQMMSELG